MFLDRIHIENVRAIAGLELDLDSHNRRWTLLLGENGTGKSTILRCIALLLCGRDALPELLGRDPSNWIRSGQTSARIHGTIATEQGAKRDVHLELRRGDTISRTLDRNAKPLAPLEDALAHTARSYFLAGYGASRRLGRAGIRGDEQPSIRAGTVRTLFDADATLRPLASWAMDLHYVKGESFLELIRSALAELLPDVTFRNIDKTRKTLIFDTADGPVSLDDLSDGYQNVAAWIGDLLYRTTAAFDDYFNPLATRGLLLIDEVDLHLHLKWQRRLRRFIDNKLPNFQIVATTHSPMTAQQAGPGEVHVLARAIPQAAPELRHYDVAPDRLGLHQLIEPFFGVETVVQHGLRISRIDTGLSRPRNPNQRLPADSSNPCANNSPTPPRGRTARKPGRRPTRSDRFKPCSRRPVSTPPVLPTERRGKAEHLVPKVAARSHSSSRSEARSQEADHARRRRDQADENHGAADRVRR